MGSNSKHLEMWNILFSVQFLYLTRSQNMAACNIWPKTLDRGNSFCLYQGRDTTRHPAEHCGYHGCLELDFVLGVDGRLSFFIAKLKSRSMALRRKLPFRCALESMTDVTKIVNLVLKE